MDPRMRSHEAMVHLFDDGKIKEDQENVQINVDGDEEDSGDKELRGEEQNKDEGSGGEENQKLYKPGLWLPTLEDIA